MTKRIDDPLSLLGEIQQGELLPDPARPEYNLYIPTPDELKIIEDWIDAEISRAEKADDIRIKKILENREAYLAKPKKKDEIITLPLCKRDANQIAASLVNAVMSKDPICTVRPDEAGSIEIMAQGPQGPQPMTISTTEEAQAIQDYGEILLRKRVKFRPQFETATYDMVRGGMPYLKVCYESQERVVREMKWTQSFDPMSQQMTGSFEERRKSLPIEEPLRLVAVDGINILIPPGEVDEQMSPWFSERYELSPTDVRRRVADGTFNFARTAGVVPEKLLEEILASGTGTSWWEEIKQQAAQLVGRDVKERPANIPFYEIWFYWPRATEDGGIEMLSLCGQWMRGKRKLASLYENFYRHGLRPYVPFFQRPEPYQYATGSTVEDLAPMQRMVSAMFHLTVKNGIQALTKAYTARKGSPGYYSLLEHNKDGGLKPGAVVTCGDMNEIEPFQTGGVFGSLSNEIGFLDSLAQQVSVVPEYQNIPNRTPSGTVSQIMAESKAQGTLTLERCREQLSTVIKMLMQTAQQFYQNGETIPFQDPKTRAILEKQIYFPTGLIDKQFSFEITATSDEDTKVAQREAETINLNLINQSNQSIGQFVFEMMNPQTPEVFAQTLKQLIMREEKQLARLLKLSHKDYEEYVFDESELNALLQQKAMFLQQQQQQAAAAAAQGGMNGQGAPAGVGAVPGAAAGGSVPPDNGGAGGNAGGAAQPVPPGGGPGAPPPPL